MTTEKFIADAQRHAVRCALRADSPREYITHECPTCDALDAAQGYVGPKYLWSLQFLVTVHDFGDISGKIVDAWK